MIAIATALKSEAEPLVEALGLTRSESDGSTYRSGLAELRIFGVGRDRALSSLAAWLPALKKNPPRHFLNIGICGGRSSYQVGATVRADKVYSSTERRSIGLDPAPWPDLPTASLYTATSPISSYSELPTGYDIVDMEAGVIAAELRPQLPSTRFMVVKVVSDHLDPQSVTKDGVSQLMRAACKDLAPRLKHFACD